MNVLIAATHTDNECAGNGVTKDPAQMKKQNTSLAFAWLGLSLGLSSLSECLHQLFYMKLTEANQPV